MTIFEKKFYEALEPTNERLQKEYGVTVACAGIKAIELVYQNRDHESCVEDAIKDVIQHYIEKPLIEEIHDGTIPRNSRVQASFDSGRIVFDPITDLTT